MTVLLRIHRTSYLAFGRRLRMLHLQLAVEMAWLGCGVKEYGTMHLEAAALAYAQVLK